MKVREIAYNLLINTVLKMPGRRLSTWWDRMWYASQRTFSGPVRTFIHGREVIVNYGFTYPVYARRHPGLNAPLVELAYQVWKAKGEKIRFTDVGAAVGDTVLLLFANLPEAFAGFVCIDGDPEFSDYLKKNLAHLKCGRLVSAVLSGSEELVPELVRTHSGTAGAEGSNRVEATTLSGVLTEPVDLLKIDVDGFDGRVLAGAERVLADHRPAVIFEWAPILCRQTGNNWLESFKFLQSAGYSRFVWFTKVGNFSHFTFQNDTASLNALAEYCLSDISDDWHYDVVALHDSSSIDIQALARLKFAKNRPSRY